MFRRSGWFILFAIATLATFAAEPRATAQFAWTAFQAVGEFGGEVVSDLNEGDATDQETDL